MVCSISNEQNSAIYLNLLKPMVESCLQKEEDRKLAARWIEILMNSIGQSELGRKYLKLLLFILPRKRLLGLFSDLPGTDFKELPEKVLDIALHLLSTDEPSTNNLDNLSIIGAQPSCPMHEQTSDFHKMKIVELSQQEFFAVATTKSPLPIANIPRKPLVSGFANPRKKVVLPPLPPIRPPPDLILECEQTVTQEVTRKSLINMTQARKNFFSNGQPSSTSRSRSLKSCISTKGENIVRGNNLHVIHATSSPYDKVSKRTLAQQEIFVPSPFYVVTEPKYRVGYETQSNAPKFEASKDKEPTCPTSGECLNESLVYIRRTLRSDNEKSSALLVTESKVLHASKERNVINASTELRQTIFPNIEANLLDSSLRCSKFQNVNSEPLVSSSDDSVLSIVLRTAHSSETISNGFESKKSPAASVKNYEKENEMKLKTTSKSMPVLEMEPNRTENAAELNNTSQALTSNNGGYFQKTAYVNRHSNRKRPCRRIPNLSQQIWVHLANVSDSDKIPSNSLDDSLLDLDQIDFSNILNETSELADASLPLGYSEVSDEERLVQQMTVAADAIEHDRNSPALRNESPPTAFFSDHSLHSNKDIVDETQPSISSVGSPSPRGTPPPRRAGATPPSAHRPRPESHGLPSPLRHERVIYRPAYNMPRNEMSPRGRPVPRENWTRRRLNFDEQDPSADQSIFDVSSEDSRLHPDQLQRSLSSNNSASGSRIPKQLPQPRDSPLTSTPDQIKRARRISFNETGYYSNSPGNISGITPPHLASISSGRSNSQNYQNVNMSSPRAVSLLDDSSFEISPNTPPQYSAGSPLIPRRQRDQYDSTFESLGAVSPPLYVYSPPITSPMQRSKANISNLSDKHLMSMTPPMFVDLDGSYVSPPAFFSPEAASKLECVTPPTFFSSFGNLTSPQQISHSPIFSMSPPIFATSPPSPLRPRTSEFPSGSFSPLTGVTPPAFANSFETPPRPVTPDFPISFFSPLGGVSPPMFASSPVSPTPPRPITPEFPSGSRSLLMSVSPPTYVDSPPKYPESYGPSIGALSPQFLASPPWSQTPKRGDSLDFPGGSRSLLMSVSPPIFSTSPPSPPRPRTPEFPSGSFSLLTGVTPPAFANSFETPPRPVTPDFPSSFFSPLGGVSPPMFASSPVSPTPPRPITPEFPSGSRSLLMSLSPPTYVDSPPEYPESYGPSIGALSPQFLASPPWSQTPKRGDSLDFPGGSRSPLMSVSPPIFSTSPPSPPRPRTPEFPSGSFSPLTGVTPPAFANSFETPPRPVTPDFFSSSFSPLGGVSPPMFASSPVSPTPPRPITPEFPSGSRSLLMSVSPPTYADSPPEYPESYGSSIRALSPQFLASPPWSQTPKRGDSLDFPGDSRSLLMSVSPPAHFADESIPLPPSLHDSLHSSIGNITAPSFASSLQSPEIAHFICSPLTVQSPPIFAETPPQTPLSQLMRSRSPLWSQTPPSYPASPKTPPRPITPPFPQSYGSPLSDVSQPQFYPSPKTPTPTRQRTPDFPSPPLNQSLIWSASPPVYPTSPPIYSTTPQTPPFPNDTRSSILSGSPLAFVDVSMEMETPPLPNDTRSSILSGSPPAFTNVSMGIKTPSLPNDTRSSILSGLPPAFTSVSMGMKTPSLPNDTRSSILSGSPPVFTNVSMGIKTPSLPNDTRSSILSGSPPRYVDITMGPQTPGQQQSPPQFFTPPFPQDNRSFLLSVSPPVFPDSFPSEQSYCPPKWHSYDQPQEMLTDMTPPRFSSTLNDSSDFVTAPPTRRRSTSQPCISATSPPQFFQSPPQRRSSQGGSPVSLRNSPATSIGNISPELVSDDSFADIPNIPNYYLNRLPTLPPAGMSSMNLRARRLNGNPIGDIKLVTRTPWEKLRQSILNRQNQPRTPITLDPQIASPLVSAQRPIGSSTPKRGNYSPPIRVRIQSPTAQRPTGSRYNAVSNLDFNLGANKITEVDVPGGSSIFIDSFPLSAGASAGSLYDSYNNTLSTTMPSYAQSFNSSINESLGGHYRSSPNVFDITQPGLGSIGSFDSPANASRAYSISVDSTPDFMNNSYNNLFYDTGNASGTSFNTASGGIADTSRPYLVSSSFSDYSGEFLSDIQPVDLTNVSMNSSCGRCR